MPNASKNFKIIPIALHFAIGLCFLYNIYALFFPIRTTLESDGAEHLHAAYLLSVGERPYLDFIQNHPMLFHHFLVWAEKFFDIASSRDLAMVARIIIFGHFLLSLAIFCLWTTRLIGTRPRGMTWAAFLLITWAMLDIYNPGFHWMWDIRPDFICYGQTLLGLYLIHLRIERSDKGPNPKNLLWAAVGGSLVGFGNAIILKGIPFIAAFVLTQVTIALKDDRAKFYSLMNFRNLRKSFIIGASAVFSFCAWVAVDCYLSKVQVGKWVSAVILLNSRKHFIFSNAGTNPIAAILEPFSVSLPLALVLVGWIIWELLNSENSARLKNSCLPIWLFSIFTILINIILPAYSNGVTWSYYFIPSVFAAAAICLVLVLRLWQIYRLRPFARPFSISQVAVVLIAGFIAVKIVNTPMYAISQWSARQAAAKEVEAASPDDFGIEERLPKDFVYLGYPDQTPIKSRNWNYYFMLARSTDFWRDCYILGLGPDPQQAWGKGFGDNPPDAIAFTQRGELSRFVFFVRECQHIDISWLFDEVRENYVLMGTRGASLYVRKDRVSHLKSQGWRILASSKTGLLPFDPT